MNGLRVDISDIAADPKGGLTFWTNRSRFTAIVDWDNSDSHVRMIGRELPLMIETSREALLKSLRKSSETAHRHTDIRTSMPGMVVRVLVEVGQAVRKGEPVLILEAMKMENEIRSPGDGKVGEVRVMSGQTVEKGDVLMALE